MVHSTKLASNMTYALSPASALPMDYKVLWVLIVVVVPLLGLGCMLSCFCNFCAWKWIQRIKGSMSSNLPVGVFSDTDSGEDLRQSTFRSICVAQTSLMETPTSLHTLGHYSTTVTASPNSDFSARWLDVHNDSNSRVVSPRLRKRTLSPIIRSKSDGVF